MAKYINADRLKSEIERFSAIEYGDNTFGDDVANGALYYVLEEIIPSIQQEQPEVDIEKEIDAIWNPRFNLGWDEKSLISVNRAGFENIARYFYLIGLNARKEKSK